jgi:Protein of unknown function (DUF3723)
VREWSFKQDLKFFRATYIQLWLYAMRNYQDLSNPPSANAKKDRGRVKSEPRGRSETKVSELAFFAAARGFETDQIDKQHSLLDAWQRFDQSSGIQILRSSAAMISTSLRTCDVIACSDPISNVIASICLQRIYSTCHANPKENLRLCSRWPEILFTVSGVTALPLNEQLNRRRSPTSTRDSL